MCDKIYILCQSHLVPCEIVFTVLWPVVLIHSVHTNRLELISDISWICKSNEQVGYFLLLQFLQTESLQNLNTTIVSNRFSSLA